MGANHPASVQVGKTIFTGTAGPVGKDGRPMVIYHGMRDTVTAFNEKLKKLIERKQQNRPQPQEER